MIAVVVAAVLPAMVLLYYIYRKDPVKEPAQQLLRGFGYGFVAAGLSAVLEMAVASAGLIEEEPSGVFSAVNTAFLGAAIPEELCKLLMLWLLLRHNRHFDEYYDGVVYAASVGLGFAAIENVLYLFGNIDQWQGVAVMRALFSVPGHLAFAVLMGYFYSLAHMGGHHTRRDHALILAVPVLAHGAFDAALFAGSVNGVLSGGFTIIFLLLCSRLVKVCRSHIRRLIAFDSIPAEAEY